MMEFFTADKVPTWILYVIAASAFVAYYYFYAVKYPMLICSSSKYKSFLETCVPAVTEKFWPTIWCFGSYAQTILSLTQTIDLDKPFERDILTLDDGGQVALDWQEIHKDDKHAPIVIILPGLTGSSTVGYVRKFASSARTAGLRSVIFNYRGMGGVTLKTPKTYSGTCTRDLEQVIQHVKNKYPGAPVGAAGNSYGGILLGNYLSRYSHEEQQLCAAMLISAPYDVNKGVIGVASGVDKLFTRYLAIHLTNSLSKFKHVLDIDGKPWQIDEVLRSKSVREFDHKFTAKQFGYESVDHYYKDGCLDVEKMKKFRIPVLCLSAADDPFQPLMYPLEDTSLFCHDKVALLLTARGGHLGFLEGLWPISKREHYMQRVFSQYFAAVFKDDNQEFISAL